MFAPSFHLLVKQKAAFSCSRTARTFGHRAGHCAYSNMNALLDIEVSLITQQKHQSSSYVIIFVLIAFQNIDEFNFCRYV